MLVAVRVNSMHIIKGFWEAGELDDMLCKGVCVTMKCYSSRKMGLIDEKGTT
jgi:hypothetical protein